MERKEYEAVRAKLNQMTPSLVNEVVALYQQDPLLVERFGNGLTELAQQGVTSLRDVLLGALKFDRPQLLGSQLKWLEQLLASRQISPVTIQNFLEHFRTHLSRDLPSDAVAEVLRVFDQAVAQIKGQA